MSSLRFLLFILLVVALLPNILFGQNKTHLDYLPSCGDSELLVNKDFPKEAPELEPYYKQLDYLGQVYCKALAQNDYETQANSLSEISQVYEASLHPEAIQVIYACSSKALDISKENLLVGEQFKALEQLTTSLTTHGFYKPAIDFGNEFLVLSQKERDTLRISEGYMLLGRTLRESGDFSESESMLNRAIELRMASKKSMEITAYAYLHLASLYIKMGKYQESIAKAKKGLGFSMFDQSVWAYFVTCELQLQVIEASAMMNDYSYGILLQEVKEFVEERSFVDKLAKCHYFEGLLMEHQGETEKAINLYSKALQYFSAVGYKEESAIISSHIMDMLQKKGDITKDVHTQLKEMLGNLGQSVGENRARYLFSSYYYKSIEEKARSRILDVENRLANEQLTNKRTNIRYLTICLMALLLISGYLFHLYRERKARERKLRRGNEQLEKQKKEIDHLLQVNNRSLYSKQLKISTIHDSIAKVAHDIGSMAESDKGIRTDQLLGLEKKLLGIISNEGTWEEFKLQFEEIHPHFFNELNKLHPNLSVNDLKHCSYVLSNLKSKEVARLINVSPRSVETTRYRLKKKLGLSQNEMLYHYLQKIVNV